MWNKTETYADEGRYDHLQRRGKKGRKLDKGERDVESEEEDLSEVTEESDEEEDLDRRGRSRRRRSRTREERELREDEEEYRRRRRRRREGSQFNRDEAREDRRRRERESSREDERPTRRQIDEAVRDWNERQQLRQPEGQGVRNPTESLRQEQQSFGASDRILAIMKAQKNMLLSREQKSYIKQLLRRGNDTQEAILSRALEQANADRAEEVQKEARRLPDEAGQGDELGIPDLTEEQREHDQRMESIRQEAESVAATLESEESEAANPVLRRLLNGVSYLLPRVAREPTGKVGETPPPRHSPQLGQYDGADDEDSYYTAKRSRPSRSRNWSDSRSRRSPSRESRRRPPSRSERTSRSRRQSRSLSAVRGHQRQSRREAAAYRSPSKQSSRAPPSVSRKKSFAGRKKGLGDEFEGVPNPHKNPEDYTYIKSCDLWVPFQALVWPFLLLIILPTFQVNGKAVQYLRKNLEVCVITVFAATF